MHPRRGYAWLIAPLILFTLWSALTLSWSLSQRDFHDNLIASAYYLRLLAHLALLPALYILCRQRPDLLWLLKIGFLITSYSLLILGFIQWRWWPDLRLIAPQGWDPHQSRLVSTWLDPNFFGSFLVVSLFPTLVLTWQYLKRHRTWIVLALLSIYSAALILTGSRSSIVALLAAGISTLPWISIKYTAGRPNAPQLKKAYLVLAVSAAAMAAVAAILSAWILRERLEGLFSYDPTVQVRLTALKKVWHLVEQYSWTGVGYNAYQFAAIKEGLISNFTIHSRAGADNSWLTLWVTLGLPGLLIFLSMYMALYLKGLHAWLARRSLINLAMAASLSALAAHALFINSLLYSHLLVVTAVISAIALSHYEH